MGQPSDSQLHRAGCSAARLHGARLCTDKQAYETFCKLRFSGLTRLEKTELDAFDAYKKALTSQATLALRDQTQHLCVYTDASNLAWIGILTKVLMSDVIKLTSRSVARGLRSCRDVSTRRSWVGLCWKKRPMRIWTISVPCTGWGLHRTALISTRTKKLILLFDPLDIVYYMSQYYLCKVLQYAVKLSEYKYKCYRIRCEENYWSDLSTR